MNNTNKLVVRKALRQQRNALSTEQQEQAAIDVLEQLQRLPLFMQSQTLALYLTNDGEIDPARVLAWSLAHGKRCYVPVIAGKDVSTNATSRALRFAEITPHTEFEPNRFGIAEPRVVAEQCIDADALDLVLVPLVGFDRNGNRIGMGGGFYDTTFAFTQTHSIARPQLVGLAHEIQRVENIDVENWDIPLVAVVTNQQIYRCRARDSVEPSSLEVA